MRVIAYARDEQLLAEVDVVCSSDHASLGPVVSALQMVNIGLPLRELFYAHHR